MKWIKITRRHFEAQIGDFKLEILPTGHSLTLVNNGEYIETHETLTHLKNRAKEFVEESANTQVFNTLWRQFQRIDEVVKLKICHWNKVNRKSIVNYLRIREGTDEKKTVDAAKKIWKELSEIQRKES